MTDKKKVTILTHLDDFCVFLDVFLRKSARNHILGRYRPSRGRYRPFQKPRKTTNIPEFSDFSNTEPQGVPGALD